MSEKYKVYDGTYFTIYEEPMLARPKTKWYRVCGKTSGLIGDIHWLARWRQYAFFMHSGTAWSHSCLDEISVFLKQLMADRRLAKQ